MSNKEDTSNDNNTVDRVPPPQPVSTTENNKDSDIDSNNNILQDNSGDNVANAQDKDNKDKDEVDGDDDSDIQEIHVEPTIDFTGKRYDGQVDDVIFNFPEVFSWMCIKPPTKFKGILYPICVPFKTIYNGRGTPRVISPIHTIYLDKEVNVPQSNGYGIRFGEYLKQVPKPLLPVLAVDCVQYAIKSRFGICRRIPNNPVGFIAIEEKPAVEKEIERWVPGASKLIKAGKYDWGEYLDKVLYVNWGDLDYDMPVKAFDKLIDPIPYFTLDSILNYDIKVFERDNDCIEMSKDGKLELPSKTEREQYWLDKDKNNNNAGQIRKLNDTQVPLDINGYEHLKVLKWDPDTDTIYNNKFIKNNNWDPSGIGTQKPTLKQHQLAQQKRQQYLEEKEKTDKIHNAGWWGEMLLGNKPKPQKIQPNKADKLLIEGWNGFKGEMLTETNKFNTAKTVIPLIKFFMCFQLWVYVRWFIPLFLTWPAYAVAVAQNIHRIMVRGNGILFCININSVVKMNYMKQDFNLDELYHARNGDSKSWQACIGDLVDKFGTKNLNFCTLKLGFNFQKKEEFIKYLNSESKLIDKLQLSNLMSRFSGIKSLFSTDGSFINSYNSVKRYDTNDIR